MRYWAPVLLFVAPCICTADWHANADVGLSVMRYTNKAIAPDTQFRPQVAFGFTRLINENWRMRTAVDVIFEQGNDSASAGNLMNWRIAELDYRISENWALSGYGGIARYDRERPALGYSIGGGAKWRVTDQWLISIDLSNTKVDISSSVPGDSALDSKDRFQWFNCSLRYSF